MILAALLSLSTSINIVDWPSNTNTQFENCTINFMTTRSVVDANFLYAQCKGTGRVAMPDFTWYVAGLTYQYEEIGIRDRTRELYHRLGCFVTRDDTTLERAVDRASRIITVECNPPLTFK